MATDTMPRTPGTPRQVPGRTAPGRTAPGRTAPGRTAPGRTAPGGTVSGSTAPGRTAPGRTVSGRTAPGRTAPGRGPARPVSAPRHTRPVTGPATRPATSPATRGRPRSRSPRAPFILLLVGLLGGALVSLLVISTTLAQGSFRITSLQQQNASLARQEQTLTNEVAQAGNPAVIAREAEQYGMRQDPNLRFVNLKTGKIVSGKVSKADAAIHVPGYNP
jgi:hypothetical protein